MLNMYRVIIFTCDDNIYLGHAHWFTTQKICHFPFTIAISINITVSKTFPVKKNFTIFFLNLNMLFLGLYIKFPDPR